MEKSWKWLFGIAAILAILLAAPFAWGSLGYSGNYPMMGYQNGWHMPMGFGGAGMMGFGMLFVWLIPPALLILMGLAIAWLIRSLKSQN